MVCGDRRSAEDSHWRTTDQLLLLHAPSILTSPSLLAESVSLDSVAGRCWRAPPSMPQEIRHFPRSLRVSVRCNRLSTMVHVTGYWYLSYPETPTPLSSSYLSHPETPTPPSSSYLGYPEIPTQPSSSPPRLAVANWFGVFRQCLSFFANHVTRRRRGKQR